MTPIAAAVRNPFMLLLQPEMVLAAVERSQRLGQLKRHLCRPLDLPPGAIGQSLAGGGAVASDAACDAATDAAADADTATDADLEADSDDAADLSAAAVD